MPDGPSQPAREIRRLLLSGDNILKNRDGQAAVDKARERFTRALAIAAEQDDAALTEIIAARLAALAPREDA